MPIDTKKLQKFPTKPGVYIMRDPSGAILYIGKAKNLKQRVKQYFVAGGDGRWMIPLLTAKVETIDCIVVRSDKEALLLENTLIKKHQPRYNALLKDDKTYIALKVTTRHRFPAVRLVRYKGKPKQDGLYFGPYTSAHAARATLELINKVFPLRECSDKELARRTRPCILYQMKRCIAPCVGRCTQEEYNEQVRRAIAFLRGNDKEVLDTLRAEMEAASEAMEFEKAGAIYRTIGQIEQTIEVQRVDKPLGEDMDAWGLFRQGEEVVLSQMIFRGGKLVGAAPFHFSHALQEDRELLRTVLLQQYEGEGERPHQILIPFGLEDQHLLAEVLGQGQKRKVAIVVPQRGDKRALVKMAGSNAQTLFEKERDEDVIRERALLDMQERFGLMRYPERIECFDNSNISGTEPVAAMVAFTEGKADKQRYRRYKIRGGDIPDDYAAMYEVLTRRLKRGKEEGDLPDLLLIDGGKGHLHVAERVLSELNIITVDVIGVAKEEGRHDKGMTAEQVFLPNRKDPLRLKKTSQTLFMLQRIRDEAHRFAITFHRQRRKKRVLSSALDKIPGIGPAKTRALLRTFGSVKKIEAASDEELLAVKGVTKNDVAALRAHLK